MPRKRKTAQPDIVKVAHERLGFESLRPGQEEAVSFILDGHDVLVVQPTGSGKSAIYQIAGLMIKGATLVVSSLIALQKDQVDSISDQTSAADAVAVNSTQRTAEIRERLTQLGEGRIEYLFLAPEQLRKPETIGNLRNSNISLFVVDEAHCISEWGHDFRPDYLSLGHVIEALGHPRVLALAATAGPRVRKEDEPDIRFVYHYDAPDSLDSYYQEIGRAGRDGERAEAVLFYRAADIGAQSYKTGEGRIETEALERLATRIADENGPVNPEVVAGEVGLSKRKITSAVQRLEDVGATETLPTGEVSALEDTDPREAARAAAEEQEKRRQSKRERLQQMRAYAETTRCRREVLLRYLGDEFEDPAASATTARLRGGRSSSTRASVRAGK